LEEKRKGRRPLLGKVWENGVFEKKVKTRKIKKKGDGELFRKSFREDPAPGGLVFRGGGRIRV